MAIKKAPEGAITNNQINDTTKNMVLSMLTTKPQSRYTLAMAIGINERTFREAVRELRREGHLIITESTVEGYRLGTKKEAERTAKELRSRAYDLLKTAKALEGADPNQLTIGEVMQL